MDRHIFRLTSFKNISQFLSDGAIWAKNHDPMQQCYQTSYADIVDRRGTRTFETPCGCVVNDFVPFYFSPITAMAYTIGQGNVKLRGPDSSEICNAKLDKIVFLVSNTQHFQNHNNEIYFTNVACNSLATIPEFESDLSLLKGHVNWTLFDEKPLTARIPQIGYNGVCRYFFNRDDGVHMNRNAQRMAEFMVKNEVSLRSIDCIIVQNDGIKEMLEKQIQNSAWNIPVYTNAGCYL